MLMTRGKSYMKNTVKLLLLTIPTAIIYIAAYAVFLIAALSVIRVDMPYFQSVPLLGAAQNSPYDAGLITIGMAFVAFLSKPINFATDDDSTLIEMVTALTMMVTVFVIIPVVIFLCIVLSPIAALKLYGGETFMFLPVIGFALLIGQAFINVRLSDLR